MSEKEYLYNLPHNTIFSPTSPSHAPASTFNVQPMTGTLRLRSLASRLWSATPSITRSINSRAAFTPVPPTRDPSVLSSPQLRPKYHLESIQSPADFLKAIGRSCETKVSVESWEDFWKKDGLLLKNDGVSVRDRRYAF